MTSNSTAPEQKPLGSAGYRTSAAVWLAKIYKLQDIPLPDYFSKELNLVPTSDPEENLRPLAKRHEELSGARVNWLGTYQHAAQVWLKGLEYHMA